MFGLSISFALKGLHILAQGKQTRVWRVFVSPWVEETPDSRPSKQRWFGRRVTEAETGRGFIAASATCRTKADVTPRPPPGVLIEPRAAAMLADQPAVSARRIPLQRSIAVQRYMMVPSGLTRAGWGKEIKIKTTISVRVIDQLCPEGASHDSPGQTNTSLASVCVALG